MALDEAKDKQIFLECDVTSNMFHKMSAHVIKICNIHAAVQSNKSLLNIPRSPTADGGTTTKRDGPEAVTIINQKAGSS